jgi:hypothetical protein
MAIERLSFEALTDLDGGRVCEAFDQAVARLEADLHDRPGVKSARQVTLTISMTPVMDENGSLEGCDTSFEVKDRIPKRKSRNYTMRAGKGGGLFFNNFAPENPNQRTIDEVIEKEITNVR